MRWSPRRKASVRAWGWVLAVLLPAGCEAPSGRTRASMAPSFDSIAAAVADIETPAGKVWFLERTPALGAYAAESRDLAPLQFRPRTALRGFVLAGRVRVRAGTRESVLGPGSYLSAPPGVSYRILPLDPEPARLLLALAPDGGEATVLEMLGVRRRLRRGGRP